MKTINLAAASMMAMLAHSVPTQLESRQQKPREPIDPNLYPVLQRYTRFAVASLATFTFNLGTCPNPPFQATLVSTINNVVTDTQVAIFRDSTAKELIVSIPGTSSLQDFVTDFTYFLTPLNVPGCDGCQVHNGLLRGWQSVRQDVVTALDSLRAKNPGYATIITGHSLGGGYASLAYTDLVANNVPVSKAYTMGSLRVGNQAYADFTDKLSGASDSSLGNLIRITHGIDGVPGLPTSQMGFVHTRTEIYEVDDASGIQSAGTTYRCYGQEAGDCNKGTAQGFINQDHLVYTDIQMTNGNECHNVD